MSHRPRASLGVLTLVAAASLMTVALAQAQSLGTAPATAADSWTAQTPWGHPDLQGVWASDSATPLQRPKQLADRQFLTDQEVAVLKQRAAELFNGDTDAAFGDSVFEAVLTDAKTFTSTDTTGNYNHFWLIDRWFDNRTSLIVDPPDGRIPPLTPEAEKRRAARAERPEAGRSRPPDGPEDLAGGLRCTGGRLPMTGRGYNSNYQIVQAPGYVAINMEMMHDSRIIPLDGRPHMSPDIRGDLGDSRGHWEGNTLVVETTNLKGGGGGGGREFGVSTGENLRLVERFTRINADTLQYEFTMNDPTTWTRPWTARIFMKPAPGTGLIYEFACHEGNYALEHALRGARVLEKTAAKVAK